MTARALIRPSAIADLERLETLDLRREAVRLASEALTEPGRPEDRIDGGSRCRRRRGRLVVLYSLHGEDAVVDAVGLRAQRGSR